MVQGTRGQVGVPLRGTDCGGGRVGRTCPHLSKVPAQSSAQRPDRPWNHKQEGKWEGAAWAVGRRPPIAHMLHRPYIVKYYIVTSQFWFGPVLEVFFSGPQTVPDTLGPTTQRLPELHDDGLRLAVGHSKRKPAANSRPHSPCLRTLGGVGGPNAPWPASEADTRMSRRRELTAGPVSPTRVIARHVACCWLKPHVQRSLRPSCANGGGPLAKSTDQSIVANYPLSGLAQRPRLCLIPEARPSSPHPALQEHCLEAGSQYHREAKPPLLSPPWPIKPWTWRGMRVISLSATRRILPRKSCRPTSISGVYQGSDSTSLRESIRNGPYEGACMHDGACAALRSSLLRMTRYNKPYVGFRPWPSNKNRRVAWAALVGRACLGASPGVPGLSKRKPVARVGSILLYSPPLRFKRTRYGGPATQTHHEPSLHFFKPWTRLCAHTRGCNCSANMNSDG